MASESYPAVDGRPLVLALVETIEGNRAYLSEVDGAIGDGDHGINMSKGFAIAKTRLGDQTISVSDGLALIGKTLMTEIGGAMGPIYGTLFIQMSLRPKTSLLSTPKYLAPCWLRLGKPSKTSEAQNLGIKRSWTPWFPLKKNTKARLAPDQISFKRYSRWPKLQKKEKNLPGI